MALILRVGHRIWRQRFLESLSTGLFFSGFLMIPVFVWNFWVNGAPISSIGILGLFSIAGLLSGLIAGILSFPAQKSSAEAIDTAYGLKDRTLTSLKILQKPRFTVMERLQILDTADFVRKVHPKIVVPYKIPKKGYRFLMIFLPSLIFCFLGHSKKTIPPTHLTDSSVDVTDLTRQLRMELLEPVAEIARKNPTEKPLENLTGELEKQTQQIENQAKNHITDLKETLATLSRMENAVSRTISEFHLEKTDASLRDLAAALRDAEATRTAAKAIQSGDYAKAAREIEKCDISDLTAAERQSVTDHLKTALESMTRRNADKMSELTQKPAQQIEKGENSKTGEDSVSQMADFLRNQDSLKNIARELDRMLTVLALTKAEMFAMKTEEGKNSPSPQDSRRTDSDNRDKKWGQTPAEVPKNEGESAALETQRKFQQVTGTLGTGDSVFETVEDSAPAGPSEAAVARRAYQEAYQDYRKMSEAVLETEPIPLGQRRMIRRYFESIRP
ncbi:MAG: hypothetical protein LBQ54_12320 [Planctomycetaceae bacterium]|nr:hypothetical protein [Planctomycetaceae bacterium]